MDKEGKNALIYLLTKDRTRLPNLRIDDENAEVDDSRRPMDMEDVLLLLLQRNANCTVPYLKPVYEKDKIIDEISTNLLIEAVQQCRYVSIYCVPFFPALFMISNLSHLFRA